MYLIVKKLLSIIWLFCPLLMMAQNKWLSSPYKYDMGQIKSATYLSRLDTTTGVVFPIYGKGNMIFKTNGFSRALFDSLGNFVLGTTSGNSKFYLAGSMGILTRQVDTSFSIPGSYAIMYSGNAGEITISLPSSAALPGRMYYFKRIGAGDVILNAVIAGDSIDSRKADTLMHKNDAVTIQAHGGQWRILNKYITTQ
jgi:hypothetical protein